MVSRSPRHLGRGRPLFHATPRLSLQFSSERAPNGRHARPPLGVEGQISGASLNPKRLDVGLRALGGEGVPRAPVARLHIERKSGADGTRRGPGRRRGAQNPQLRRRRQRRVPKRMSRQCQVANTSFERSPTPLWEVSPKAPGFPRIATPGASGSRVRTRSTYVRQDGLAELWGALSGPQSSPPRGPGGTRGIDPHMALRLQDVL